MKYNLIRSKLIVIGWEQTAQCDIDRQLGHGLAFIFNIRGLIMIYRQAGRYRGMNWHIELLGLNVYEAGNDIEISKSEQRHIYWFRCGFQIKYRIRKIRMFLGLPIDWSKC
jgi:hypothetical protein